MQNLTFCRTVQVLQCLQLKKNTIFNHNIRSKIPHNLATKPYFYRWFDVNL